MSDDHSGWVPFYRKYWTSSIILEPPATREVWKYLFSMCAYRGKERGRIRIAPPVLANQVNITLAETERALAVLKSPDPYSTTKKDEGRRIREIEPGYYEIINYDIHARGVAKDHKTAYMREYMAKKRAEERANVSAVSPPLAVSNDKKEKVESEESMCTEDSYLPVDSEKEKSAERARVRTGNENEDPHESNAEAIGKTLKQQKAKNPNWK